MKVRLRVHQKSINRAGRASWLAAMAALGSLASASTSHAAQDGIRFSCSADQIPALQAGMGKYFSELGVASALYQMVPSDQGTSVTYTLRTPPEDHDTLGLSKRPEMAIGLETVLLPQLGKPAQPVRTVSRKEIALALMQHGRLTAFEGPACDVQALKDHVNLRQNIVAWSEELHWRWPNGGPAKWNTRYWDYGTPVNRHALPKALLDAFTHQHSYAIGCYTASKMVTLQGVVDFYQRVRGDKALSSLIDSRVWADADPLVNIEPGDTWSFEEDFDPQEKGRPGKLVKMLADVAPKNFVPGDWAYMVNTDPATHHKIGYEGSNALYLGRNLFDDYYDDHRHAYTYTEKLDEVYQWRNGVFSRSRDAAKLKPLSKQAFEHMGLTPEQGGMVMGYRLVPYLFGYEPLPAIGTTANAAQP
jgi:hypothetical protein